MRRLKEVREDRGLSQSELARRAGVTQQAIAQYESGTRAPSGEALVSLSLALGVSPAYLLERTDSPERIDHLPPEWEKVVEEALETGLSPEDVRRAMRMLRVALGQEDL